MEYSHSCTTVLDSWSWCTYPQQHHRRSLLSILLHSISTYIMSATWWNIIQLLHDHLKCSLLTKIGIRRWRLQEQFRETSTYQLHWEEHWRSMMCPVTRMLHLIQIQLYHAVLDSHLRPVCRQLTYSSSNYVDTSEDEAPSPSTNSWITPHRPNPQPSTSRGTLDAQVKKRISRLYSWMMNIGLLKKSLTEHYAYTNISDHMDYACICPHMQTTCFLPMSRPWIWVTFLILRISWSLPVMRTYLHLKLLHTERTLVSIEH